MHQMTIFVQGAGVLSHGEGDESKSESKSEWSQFEWTAIFF